MAHYAGKNFILDLHTLQFAKKVDMDVTGPAEEGVPKFKIELTVFAGEGHDVINVEFLSAMERNTEYSLLIEAVKSGEASDYPFPHHESAGRSLSCVLGGIVEYVFGPTMTSKPNQGK